MTTPHYTSKFATGAYGNTFLRALKSEFLKLRQRSMRLTVGIFGVLIVASLVVVTSILRSQGITTTTNLSSVARQEPFFTLCAVIIGALAVTSEYSSNTMRTSTLATPKRGKALVAKVLATALYMGMVAVVIEALSALGLVISSGGELEADGQAVSTLALLVAISTIVAVMSLGIGYLVRSIAATMGIMLSLILLLPLVGLIFLQFETYRTHIPPLYPSSLISSVLETETSILIVPGTSYSPGAAFAILCGYALAAVFFGYLRYRKSDV
ncbi:ABC-2 family transporter protein [Arcanobacterium phocae]|uniref:ABC-2 family transporter protein n=1 Tax=Arcanobacterium phocae TaxID=131112 RepID=A0A1H2LDJ8_9ACTO|nr:ABC transporter permease subunit [Arcanobacterium phocae]SDU79073.1 ABC-2 family transporter protein [Arcanobacterium phocae]